MKFVSIWKVDPTRVGGAPTQEQMTQMGGLIAEMIKAGVLVDTGGVMQGGASMRVRRAGVPLGFLGRSFRALTTRRAPDS